MQDLDKKMLNILIEITKSHLNVSGYAECIEEEDVISSIKAIRLIEEITKKSWDEISEIKLCKK